MAWLHYDAQAVIKLGDRLWLADATGDENRWV